MYKIINNRFKLLRIFFVLLTILIVLTIANELTYRSRVLSKTISFPDSSAPGVARNFYEWYVSCNEEFEEEEDEHEDLGNLSECHRNTTYLSKSLVDRLNEEHQIILCSHKLTFYEIGIGKIIESEKAATVDIINIETKQTVNRVNLEKTSAGWQINDLKCIQ